MLKIKGWSQAHDESDVEVIVTVTRCVDPANNSNKYRRFLSVWAPGELPYVFTHTGRWVTECDSSRWNDVGTYRAGALITQNAWSRACRNVGASFRNGSGGWGGSGPAHLHAHEAAVQRKLGEYKITQGARIAVTTNANVQTWLRKADVIEASNGNTGATPAPTTTPGFAPYTAAPAPAPTKAAPTRLPDTSPLMSRVQNALQRSVAEGADPFDVMSDVALLRKEVGAAISELQDMASDLSLANNNAMERI